jgi:hypothetical protein
LTAILKAHFGDTKEVAGLIAGAQPLIDAFIAKRREGDLATDQLLNAFRLRMSGGDVDGNSELGKVLLRPLSGAG